VPHTVALERLQLLLAGAGARVRRLLGEGPDATPLERVATAGLPEVAEAAAGAADAAAALLETWSARGWRWLVPGEPGFPDGLAALSDPPLGVFVRGRLPGGPAAAVVGSRRATAYGRRVARWLGEELAAAGIAVVSGMARGVDAAAHEGALAAGGPTVAVWGTGPDRVYPPEHARLAGRIAACGALLTEFPPGTPPRPHHFPQRNRLIAGLAAAVVVVEAGRRSGALVTARLALEEGRDVWAVPGSLFADASVGPNALLRAGARPLVLPADLVEELVGSTPPPGAGAAPPADPVLSAVPADAAAAAEEVARAAGLPVERAVAELVRPEIEGRVERLPDGRYQRR